MGKKLSREEEERLWMISAVPYVPSLILVIIYLETSDSMSFTTVISYGFLLLLPLFFTAICLTFELVSSLKMKETLSFRARRLLSRATLAFAYGIGFFGLWNLLAFLLSSVLRVEYILILSLFMYSFVFLIFVRNERTRRIIEKLTMKQE